MPDPSTNPPTVVDATALLSARERLRELEGSGWTVTETSPRTVRLSRSGTFNASTTAAELLVLDDALADVRVVGRRGPAVIELGLVGPTYEVRSLPEVAPDQIFDDPADLAAAALAWERDGQAALGLPFEWSIVATLALDRLLLLSSATEAHVVLSDQPIRELTRTTTVRDLDGILPGPSVRRLYVAVDAPAASLHLGSISFVGLSGATTVAIPQRSSAPHLDTVNAPGNSFVQDPTDLLPIGDVPEAWQEVAKYAERLAALVAWLSLASNVEIGPPTIVEFMGFKRARLTLPEPGELEAGSAAQAIELFRWVASDPSPDRFLAVRQVVSLYHGIDAVRHARDILESAQSVFLGLRSDAVAEVIKSTREAQAQALDTVRQSLKAAQDLAKNSTERVLATLISVGAVVIANAAKTLSDKTSRNLLLFVAAFLGLLTLFALMAEGPLSTLPLKRLKEDLRRGSRVLSDAQLESVAAMPSVISTKRLVTLVRFGVPAVYVAVAILLILFGFPSHYR